MLRGADLVAALGLAALLGPDVLAAAAGPGRWLVLLLAAAVWLGGLLWLRRLARGPLGAGLRPSSGLVAAGAAAAWVLESVLVWRTAQCAGLEIGLTDAVVVTAVTIAAQAVAIAPGGIGTYEAAAVGAYVALGAEAGDALAAALTAHALTTGYALLGGALALALPGRIREGRPGPLATQSPRAR
jgi:uncharacterized membrane protein YbhN (UPF0104 family)